MNERHSMLKNFIILLSLNMLLMPGTYGTHVIASGGDGNERGSVSMNIDVADDASVNSRITIDEADIHPATSIKGHTKTFEQTHTAADGSGKTAQVYVKVTNAPKGLTYDSKITPKGGNAKKIVPWVLAEHWLTVPSADSIDCSATASYGTLSADVGLELRNGPSLDHVTLTHFYGKAYASDGSDSAVPSGVGAIQTAGSGSGDSIRIYGNANSGVESISADTAISSISDLAASFQGLDASSYAGMTTKVFQKEQISGQFTSTATSDTGTKTRSSNYGTQYDLDAKSIEGSAPIETVGYYVDGTQEWDGSPMTIQGGVDAADPYDIIKVAAGTYNENVVIDKSLTVSGKGSGVGGTIVDGQQKGSGFTINPSVTASLSGMAIQNGYAENGGGVHSNGILTVEDCTISGNTASNLGGGVWNGGTITVSEVVISGNSANNGGGIHNSGTTTINDGTIIDNYANYEGGGIHNSGTTTVNGGAISGNFASSHGGGIINSGTTTVNGVAISGNSAGGGGGIENSGTITVNGGTISGNFAGSGGGIENSGTTTVNGGTISGNSADIGGGIWNWGTTAINGGTIIDNYANYEGGGIYNYGTTTINGGIYGVLTVNGGTISGNSAKNSGGGICNLGGTTTINDGTISDNFAYEGGGIGNWGTATVNGVSISGNSANWEGGGIFNYGITTVNGGTISDNSANTGGGIFGWGTTTINGGAISDNSANVGGGIFNGGTVTVNEVAISSNSANYNGGGIGNCGTTTVNGGTISGNDAGDGGGILNSGTASVNGVTISDNFASSRGGGIANWWGTITANEVTISGNSAIYGGGGIFNLGGSVTLTDSSIAGNIPDETVGV